MGRRALLVRNGKIRNKKRRCISKGKGQWGDKPVTLEEWLEKQKTVEK